jgi:hypothetical protein
MVVNVNIVHSCDDSHGELYFDDNEVCAEVSYIIDDTNGNQSHFEVARRPVRGFTRFKVPRAPNR